MAYSDRALQFIATQAFGKTEQGLTAQGRRSKRQLSQDIPQDAQRLYRRDRHNGADIGMHFTGRFLAATQACKCGSAPAGRRDLQESIFDQIKKLGTSALGIEHGTDIELDRLHAGEQA